MIVKTIDNGYLPFYAQPGDAGADLTSIESVVIKPGDRSLVSTGIKVAIPNGYAGFIMPRSGLASKKGVTVLNTPGVIDSGYRGELKVLLYNTDFNQTHIVEPGDRIAQLVIMPVLSARFVIVDDLEESVRGESGFGSTGYSEIQYNPDAVTKL